MLLFVLACVKAPMPEPAVVAPVLTEALAVDPLDAAYAAGLTDAAFPLPSEVVTDLLPLVPGTAGVRFDDAGRVLVTTWTRSAWYADPPYAPGHVFSLYGETWFTAGGEVAEACAGLPAEAAGLRLEQLLGLPAGGGRDVFLQVWVDPAALFRPCATPEVTATSCEIAAPLTAKEGAVSWSCDPASDDPHARWLCATWVNRYGASRVDQRYPWTALGYTYDWAPGADPVGATEFVAPKGTEVTLDALVPLSTLCGSP